MKEYMPLSEAEAQRMLRVYQSGGPEAKSCLHRVIQSQTPIILSVVESFHTKCFADADDLASEIVCGLIEAYKIYDSRRSQVNTFTWTIASNIAHKHTNSKQACELELWPEDRPYEDFGASYVNRLDEFSPVWESMQRVLSEDERSIVVMKSRSASFTEIAKFLSISRGLAHKMYHGAIEKLRQNLTK